MHIEEIQMEITNYWERLKREKNLQMLNMVKFSFFQPESFTVEVLDHVYICKGATGACQNFFTFTFQAIAITFLKVIFHF